MPMRDYACDACGKERVQILSCSERPAETTFPCESCPGTQRYAGLGSFSVRTPLPTGGYTQDGQFIRGWFDGNAPRRRARNITTYK